jgi:serine/threonine-protein kinase
MAPRARDTLFGETVTRAGLCTRAQIGECLGLQEQRRAEGQEAPRLGELLVEHQYLTREQLEALLRGRYRRQNGRFGEVAVRLSLCFSDDVSRALERQAAADAAGQPHRRLGQLLVDTGALERHHVGTVLEAMGLAEQPCPSCGKTVTVPADDGSAACPQCGRSISATPGTATDPRLAEMSEVEPDEVSGLAQAIEEGHPPQIAAPRPPKAKLLVEQPQPQSREVTGAPGPAKPAKTATFAGYRIIARLGTNATGGLYLATKTDQAAPVTLKIFSAALSEDAEFAARFKSAARDGVILKHEFINRVIDVGRDRGRIYCASEYIKGRSLRYLLEKQGRFKPQLALNIGRQIAEALSYAHGQGVVHGDLKPGNVILSSDFRVKIANFGVVNNPLHNLLAVSRMSGSVPIYAAPELASESAKPTVRSEIYSLGAVLYHAITGRPPYEGSSPLHTLARVAEEELRPPGELVTGLHEKVDRVIMAMLSVEPGQRHSEMSGVVEDLIALGAEDAPKAKTASRRTPRDAPAAIEVKASPEAAEAARGGQKRLVTSLIPAAAVGLICAALAVGLVVAAPDPGAHPLPEISMLPEPAADAPVLSKKPSKPRRPASRPRIPIGGF